MGSDASRPGQESPVGGAVALFGSFRYGQYYENILSGVVAGAEAAGSSVIAIQVSDGGMPSSSEVDSQDAVTRAAWDHFEGAIIILQSLSLEYVAQLRAAGKFLVSIGQEPRGTQSSVGIDNVDGVRQAVSHLAGHGHTEIAFLSPSWQIDTPERYNAYSQQLTELGLTPLPRIGADLSPAASMDEQGYLAAQEFIAARRTCTAVLVGTDLIALGFVRGLQESGVDIPGEVAVVGIDDVDEAAVSVPPLATVAISFERVGRVAFEVAFGGGKGEPMDSHYLVSERFVPRESCGCSSGSAAGQATALGSSPLAVFVQVLSEVVGEGVHESSVDPVEVVALAEQMAGFIQAGRSGVGVEDLATRINELCPLDRSVQAALRAVRALAHALTDQVRDQEPAQALELSFASADLCDAIRSAQLQRRMSEYVDLKRMQVSHYYFIGNSLLSHDRDELRSLGWLKQTPAQAGALCLWDPMGQSDEVLLQGLYERKTGPSAPAGSAVRVESFPPSRMLREPTGEGRIVVITQVCLEDSDWGLLAVAGGRVLQSALVQEMFQQWSILISASLDQEQANADLARQAAELNTAYETEMALLDEVRVSEERYALAADAGRDALWDWDIASGKVFYSSNWKALLGYLEAEVGTAPDEWLGRVHVDDALMVQEQVNRTLTGFEQFIDFEHRLKVSTGEYRWMACSGRSVLEGGRPVRLVGSITDVTVRRLLQEQLLQEAMYDGLTGLAKSTMFKDRLNEAFALSRQKPEFWFAVLFLDLDGFKAVNDDLGHAAGDELLASVAKRLQSSLRKNDTAARLGGDEFAVILTDVDQVSELPFVVDRIQKLIRQPHQVGDQLANVDAAIGVAISSGEFATAEDMLHEADTAMYRAKRRNKQVVSGAAPATARLTVE